MVRSVTGSRSSLGAVRFAELQYWWAYAYSAGNTEDSLSDGSIDIESQRQAAAKLRAQLLGALPPDGAWASGQEAIFLAGTQQCDFEAGPRGVVLLKLGKEDLVHLLSSYPVRRPSSPLALAVAFNSWRLLQSSDRWDTVHGCLRVRLVGARGGAHAGVLRVLARCCGADGGTPGGYDCGEGAEQAGEPER